MEYVIFQKFDKFVFTDIFLRLIPVQINDCFCVIEKRIKNTFAAGEGELDLNIEATSLHLSFIILFLFWEIIARRHKSPYN